MNDKVETLTQFYAAINRYDVPAIMRHFDPQIVRVEPEGFPTSGTFRGLDELEAHIVKGRGSWAEGSCDPEKFLLEGDKAVVYLHAHVRKHGATEWIDGRFADGFVFCDGRLVEFRTFGTRAEALAWAGMEDPQAA